MILCGLELQLLNKEIHTNYIKYIRNTENYICDLDP